MKNRIVILLGIFSISVFLYANQMYNDVIYVMLSTVCLYITTKQENKIQDTIILSLLLFLQFIIRPVRNNINNSSNYV